MQKQEKSSVKTPFYGNRNIYNMTGMPYPIDEARRLLAEIKELIIGHRLEKVLVRGINNDSYELSDTEPISEYNFNLYDWEGPFIFIINEQQFEVDMSAPNHYELALNTIEFKNIVETKNEPEEKFGDLWVNQKDNVEYLNISQIFEDNVLKQKITDIELTAGNGDDEYQYLENIIIKFDNGQSLLIEEGIDNPMIKIISEEKAK